MSAAAQAERCLDLWRSVAVNAICEASAEICKADSAKYRQSMLDYHMRYFLGREWREVCSYAGIEPRPDLVRKFLLSGKALESRAAIYTAFGFSKLEQAAIDA